MVRHRVHTQLHELKIIKMQEKKKLVESTSCLKTHTMQGEAITNHAHMALRAHERTSPENMAVNIQRNTTLYVIGLFHF